MSLIEEALRRAQDPSATAPSPAPQAPPQRPTIEPPAPHSWSPAPSATSESIRAQRATPASLLVTAAGFLCVAGLILGGVWWVGRFAHHPSTTGTLSAIPSTQGRAAAPAATQPPQETSARTKHTNDSPWVLNGVVAGSGAPYALINDTIVGVGEAVGDATVAAIADGSVILRQADGTELALQLAQ